jgi:hypothetical protein
MNDLEELLPFKRFQDHFVNLLKQRYPVRVLTAMIGGDYFPRNRDSHDSEAVLKGIMEDIKSIPKGTPLEFRHKEYFSIFRRNAFKRFCVCKLDGFLTMDKYGVGFKCGELGRGHNATDYKYGVNEPYTMSAHAKSMVVGLMHYMNKG